MATTEQKIVGDTYSKPQRHWLRRFLIFILPVLVLVGAIVGFAILGAMKEKPEEKEEAVKALPVLTSKAYSDVVTLSVNVQGEVQPRSQINLVPQVSGRLAFMSPKFIEGGAFNKGDLLIRVEPAEYELRVVQARANVAQAETAVVREKSESQIALRDWQELGSGEAPSALTLREPQMAEAAARLEASKAQLAEAELHLFRTNLYAPFTGRVIQRYVNQGAYVTVGQQIGEIYSTDIMDVRLPMTNQDLARAGLKLGYQSAKIGEGIPVRLSANIAGTDASWDAEIVRTDSRFDPETRVLFAYAEVHDPFGKAAKDGVPLAPGIFVTADIRGEQVDGAVLIPRAGLRGKNVVYIANDDETLTIRSVTVRATDRDRAIITSGLAPGERVVTSPIRGAADGMNIDIVEASTILNTSSAE
ncbi:MAG: efflux RND transporter periplasmic adaptor subunit [Hellea sp.]|nr:efflux RND transporter periplasmic adaptor subunit [Hellea sp.]